MSTKVYTESICDVCGKVERVEDTGDTGPIPTWCNLQLFDIVTKEGVWVAEPDIDIDLCPACAQKIRELIRS